MDSEVIFDEEGYADSSDELKLHYAIVGSGEPIFMLAGGPGYSFDYILETKSLASLARLVFIDQRGTGKSSKPSSPSCYTIAAGVEDLEAIRKKLGFEKIALFGHSWGGMLAQEYALKYPSRTSKLILSGTLTSQDDFDELLDSMRSSLSKEDQAAIQRYEEKGLYKDGSDHYPEEYERICGKAYSKYFADLANAPPYVREALANSSSRDVYRAMWGEESEFKITGTLREFNPYPRLGEITCPTLVIVGANDMPTLKMAKKAARAIPKAKLVVFERSGHFPYLAEKEKFLQVVGDFLAAPNS